MNVTGTGDAVIWMLDSLDVVISAAGEVEYYGNPSMTQDISGIGSLSGLGEK